MLARVNGLPKRDRTEMDDVLGVRRWVVQSGMLEGMKPDERWNP
jgi:hypothetical protein